jgi:ubiquinone/menaquinone biosynthesis C-methylase UbiE
LRRRYYDLFARVYDRFVAWHSGSASASMRGALAALAVTGSERRALDLCCGTGAATRALADRLPGAALAVGLDFSGGMLARARLTTMAGECARIRWVQADAAALPFRSGVFGVVTCAYALYELKGTAREAMLREVAGVLRPSGRFLAMEHEVPARPLPRLLFFLRLAVIGAEGARAFLGGELQELGRIFPVVRKETLPSGKSKVLIARVADAA